MSDAAELSEPSVSGTGGLLGGVGLRTVIQWLHLSAAAVIVASAIFMRSIMIPLLDVTAPEQISVIVHRFYSIFPWIALVILLSTGLLNYLLWLADTGYTPTQSLRTRYVLPELARRAAQPRGDQHDHNPSPIGSHSQSAALSCIVQAGSGAAAAMSPASTSPTER